VTRDLGIVGEAEDQLGAIIGALPALVSLVGADQRYRFASRLYESWFGITPGAIVGKHMREVLGDELYELVRPRVLAVLEGREVTFETMHPGSQRQVRVSYSPHRARSGGLDGFVVMVIDISEMKEAQRALAEASRHKDEFLAMLSHELRSPLASAQLALELIEAASALEGTRRPARILRRQVSTLNRLVDDLLDASRLTRGQVHLRKERLDLPTVVRQAADSVSALVTEKGHSLVVAGDAAELAVEADPVRLEQVLVNLLTNAAKYTDPGGRIEIRLERLGDQARIGIKDSGIGIEPARLARVFELFEQGERGIDRAKGGLGIGLTIVKRLVELHGGAVEARSEGIGRGSEFVVELPLALEH
jgi:PAS domain S-box-containing protein